MASPGPERVSTRPSAQPGLGREIETASEPSSALSRKWRRWKLRTRRWQPNFLFAVCVAASTAMWTLPTACSSGLWGPLASPEESVGINTRDSGGKQVSAVIRSRLATLDKRRSFQAPDGAIYILGPIKTMDGGRRMVSLDESDPNLGTSLNEMEMNSIFSRQGLFIALRNKLLCEADGRCVGKMWRSLDDFKTIREEETTVLIPEAGRVENGNRLKKPADGYANEFDEWVGLFFHRGILEMPDGSLIAAMYGNFEEDNIQPTNPRSILETKYKHRTFVVRSTDHGQTWRYLASVAVPRRDVGDDTEGYNEWSIIRLDDGRLFGVMRTGHYTSLVASWSSDDGKTWTEPVAPEGLDPGGCDPYLLKLSDGRVALAYGQLVPPPEPIELYWEEYEELADHRRRCRIAISEDGSGESWVATTVADYTRRWAYPTIHEVEPNVILYQTDDEVWRVELNSTR